MKCCLGRKEEKKERKEGKSNEVNKREQRRKAEMKERGAERLMEKQKCVYVESSLNIYTTTHFRYTKTFFNLYMFRHCHNVIFSRK